MNDPTREKYMIWSNIDLDYEDWKADLESEYPDMNEDEQRDLMYEINDSYLDDERLNLDIQCPRGIIVIGDLGRWHGRVSGYKMIESGNIKDCLYSNNDDYIEWYVDKDGEMRGTGHHHDGTNHYLYRAVRENATDDQVSTLQDCIYMGKATEKDIESVTERLGDKIGAVYGWDFPPKKETQKEKSDRGDAR
jgi:hypothetical protein